MGRLHPMPFDEKLADRVRKVLASTRSVTEKKMFGGLCFLIKGNMVCGVERNKLMLRVGPDQYEAVLAKKHARPMDFTGRPLKGFVYVSSEGYQTAASLKKWIETAVKFAGSPR
jgi:TfoX/Sxy family transcriptional regulator of competence genes